MVAKAGYTRTEAGVFPEDWSVKQLRDVLTAARLGGNYKNQDAETQYPLMKMGNVSRSHFDVSKVEFIAPGIKPEPVHRLAHGDVIFNTRNTLELVGKVAMWRDELPVAYYNSNLMRLEFDNGEVCSNEYANYFLNSAYAVAQLRGLATGTTSVAAIYGRDLHDLPFVVPPATEQRAIASVLGDADALLDALDRLIAKKRDLKHAAVQALLTGKQRLPGFIDAWKSWRFCDLFRFLGTANNPRADFSTPGDVGYIHYGDIHMSARTVLDCSMTDLPLIEASKVEGIPFLEDGDLIMVDASEDYAGIGKCVELFDLRGRRIVAGLHTLLLRGNERLIARGFRQFMQFIPGVKDALIRIATGISVYGISRGNVGGIEVLLPSTKEQTAIAMILGDFDCELIALDNRLLKARAIKTALMQQLLTGKTRLMSSEFAHA